MTMGKIDDVHGELTARLWLYMLRQGGRWNARDLARGTGDKASDVSQMLSGMARINQARKYPVDGMERRFTYGVTGDCKVPRQVNVRSVSECLLAQPEEA